MNQKCPSCGGVGYTVDVRPIVPDRPGGPEGFMATRVPCSCTPGDGKTLLRIEEAASEFPIGTQRLRKLCREGHLPSMRIGRTILVLRSDLELWLHQQAAARVGWESDPSKTPAWATGGIR